MFTTAQLPEKAGIDPFALLIDRIPDENMKNVTLSQQWNSGEPEP